MNGEKNLKVALLLDIYAPMLTEKQREVIDLYYNEDLSLSEIAEHMEITRQGVRDSIKRGEQTLFGLEEALGVYSRTQSLLRLADSLEEQAKDGHDNAPLLSAAERIREILQ